MGEREYPQVLKCWP